MSHINTTKTPILRACSALALLLAVPMSAAASTSSVAPGSQLSARSPVDARVPGSWQLRGSTSALAAAGGTNLVGDLAARWQTWRHLGLTISGRLGWLRGNERDTVGIDTADHLMTALCVGPTATTGARRRGWEGHATAALCHVHHATWGSWKQTPAENIGGDSNGGVRHRNGFEPQLGVTAPELAAVVNFGVIAGVDLVGAALPTSDVLNWTAGARLTLGLRRLLGG